jgi:hypothetical protein
MKQSPSRGIGKMSLGSFRARLGAVFSLVLTLAACAQAQGNDKPRAKAVQTTRTVAVLPAAPLSASERKAYLDAGTLAWKYFQKNTNPTTGLTQATPEWANTTLWDIGAQLLAMYSAKELGIITADEYQKRMTKALNTVEKAPLYRNLVYNRVYSVTTGRLGPADGWSAMDLGRFLAALKIIAARDPQFAAQAERIAKRSDLSQVAYEGYLHGEMTGSRSKPYRFQEGRIGYEQYAATGFNQWGAPVANALRFELNAEPFDVLGVPLFADTRYDDRLVSEPFILMGLEFGLDGSLRNLAANILKAQEARFKTTGKMTIVSEDAVSQPPDYFYYYCVICSRKPFVVGTASPGKERDTPRWVSTKGAYGWDAIMPDDYTRQAVAAVAPAMDPAKGWASGVYESNGESTKTIDINTAAVMLEIALFKLRGSHPLMQDAAVQLH